MGCRCEAHWYGLRLSQRVCPPGRRGAGARGPAISLPGWLPYLGPPEVAFTPDKEDKEKGSSPTNSPKSQSANVKSRALTTFARPNTRVGARVMGVLQWVAK
jgi:hypothetical protein